MFALTFIMTNPLTLREEHLAGKVWFSSSLDILEVLKTAVNYSTAMAKLFRSSLDTKDLSSE